MICLLVTIVDVSHKMWRGSLAQVSVSQVVGWVEFERSYMTDKRIFDVHKFYEQFQRGL